MYMIKEMPADERPRERLKKYGKGLLLTHELLAIILRTGSKQESVLELSKRVLYEIESLSNLKDMTLEELTKHKGLGFVKATQILAAIELGKRVNNKQNNLKQLLSPKDVFNFLKDDLKDLKQEYFIAIFLDTKSQVINKKTLFIGSLNKTLIHPREIFKYAVKHSAAAIILSHNHPSGDSSPSSQDIEMTIHLAKIGEMMDIEIQDHVIIGYETYYSLKEHNKF